MKINYRKVIFWVPLLCILFLPLFFFLFWFFKDNRELNVLVVDKTVYSKNAQEHQSFNWILKNEKWVNSLGEYYDKNNQYFGFFPLENDSFLIKDFSNLNKDQLDSIADSQDVIYYADTYGVYENEWKHKTGINERSKLIYGGTRKRDVDLIECFKEQNKLVIAEFNLVASPTRQRERKRLEKMFDFEWSGWVGRFYNDLDTFRNKDLPYWLKHNVVEQHKSWTFENAGIVLVNEGGHVEILEMDKDITVPYPIIYSTGQLADSLQIPQEIKYTFWFDILKSRGENREVSTYRIKTTNRGDSILNQAGIPSSFPAAIISKDSKFVYFCGDFADNDINQFSSNFRGIEWLSKLFFDGKDETARQYFFWQYYHPFVKNILNYNYCNN